jgi:hypothetical protein
MYWLRSGGAVRLFSSIVASGHRFFGVRARPEALARFDSSAFDRWATRWRGVFRYKFGPDISGYSFGLAISF